jgi:hypothetical protein
MTVVAGQRVEHGWTPKLPKPVIIAVLAVIVVAAVVAAVVVSTSGGAETSQAVSSAEAVTPAASTQAAPDLRSDQALLAELANVGYIPSAAVDWRQLKTEELANQGLIPAQTLEPYIAPSESLFSESELLTMELAQSGQIPMQAVDWKAVEMKKLVNEGFIPRQALEE